MSIVRYILTTELSEETFHLTSKKLKIKKMKLTPFQVPIYSPPSISLPHQPLTSRTIPLFSSHHPHSVNKILQKIVMMKNHSILPLFSLPLLLILFSHSTTTLAQSPAAAPTATHTTVAATPAPAPSSPPTDIIRILKKAGGYTTLIRLLQTTQVSTQINSQLMNSNGGLTFFAPNDNAFSSLKSGFLNSLNDQQKNELIQFHLLPTYVTLSNFDTLSNPVRTQAGENPDRLALNITSSGNQVNMTTGVVNVTVSGTVYTDHLLAVYQIDKVLLPRDFFEAKPPAPAPAPQKTKGSKKKSADSTESTPADVDSAAISVKQQRHVIGVSVAVVTLLVAAFS